VLSQGGDAVQVTRRGGREAFEWPDGKRLLYAKLSEPGIWSVSVEGGEEMKVMEKAGMDLWAVSKDGICFLEWKDLLHPLMQFYRFRNRRFTTLYEFPPRTFLERGATGLSVSPGERWVLYAQIDQAGSNLVLVENFH
jgi:hypothetical protein